MLGCIWLLFVTSLLSKNICAADRLVPVIIAIGGTGTPKVITEGKEKDALVGSNLEYGSILKTGPTNSISLTYPDQSIVTIEKNSKYTVVEKRAGSEVNQLDYGQIHGVIEKSEKSPSEKAATGKPPKFMVRSKTVTMGVRGTEFLMGVDPFGLKAKVFTIEGSVDVATSETNLLSGKVTPVERGNFVSSTEKGIKPPEPFNQKEIQNLLKRGETVYPSAAPPSSIAPGGGVGMGGPGLPGGGAGTGGVGLGGGGGVGGARISPDGNVQNPDLDQRVDPNNPRGNQNQGNQANNGPYREKDKDVQNFRLLSFQTGIFYSPTLDTEITRALFIAWSPTLTLPILSCLSVRGHFGLIFAKNGSFGEKFLGKEFEVFATATLLGTFFVELGGGEQIFSSLSKDGGVFGGNAGVILGKDRTINRLWFGISSVPGSRVKQGNGIQNPNQRNIGERPEVKLGVGINF